ncbi:MAG: hypothetical protein K8963_03760, partial [Proteobacteria bacterium]|nr:hypothetical protein [Pseudomonadota bacterium]
DDDTDHETATITYTVAGGDYASLTQAAQPVAVTDTTVVVDPSVSVTVNPANASISEGQMATLTFAISPLPAAAVTIDLAAAVASTAAADDYSFSATQVSIGTDGMSTPANITVTSTDDDTDEDDETLVIAYTVSAGATAPPNTTLTLSDDDARGISSTAAATVAVDEGAQTTYTLVLDSRPTETVTVSLASDDIAIATVLPAQLTFTSTNWNTAQTVTVSGTADVDTDRETASITYTVAGGDYATVTLAAQPVDVTDTTPGALPAVSVTVDPVDASISEGQTATLTFAIRPMPAAAVTIDLAAAVASTAAAADDYSFSATQVSIGTDGMSTPTSITVTSTDDDTDEDDETLVIAYTASTGATAPPNTTVTIIDDDARGISTTAAATVAVDEGADTTYTLVLDSRPTETVTINLASNNAATATVLPAQLTFTNANWNIAQTVTVSGTADADTNDATTNINYTVTGGDYASFALAAQPVAVTDTTVEIPIITVSTVPVGGASEEGMTFMLNFAVSSSPSERIFVDLSVNPTSTATVTDDYTLVHPRVTINTDGSTTPQAVLVTTIDGDEIDEADETIIIDYAIGAGPAGVVAPASTTLTLTDDPSDVRGLTFKGADTLALSEEGEGSTITYSVKLNSEPSADVTLVVTSSDPGAVSVSSNNIVFNSVNWNSDARITLAAVGDGDPNHESVSISYTLSGGDYEGFVAPTHMAVVTDAEAPPPALPVLTITADVLSADEGGVITLSFAVSEAPTQDVTVNLSVPSASPTVGSSDYELSANSVTINTNGVVMPATVTVSVLDDNRLEFDEMITVSYLAATSGVVSIPTATHTLTLTDTDTSDLIVAPLTIDEDDITARVQFSTENSLAFDQNTQFDVALTALTAQPGTDYTAIAMDFSATIASGTAIGFVNVGIINDSVIEDSEQFTVTLTPRAAPPGLSASAQSGMVTINDDDGTVFVPQVVTVTEGTNTAATFNLTLAQVLPFAVDVQLTISGVTARAGTDYTNFNPTPMVVTIPAGMLSVPVEIPIIDDNLVEPNESFTVSVPMNGVISNGAPVAAVESLALVASVTIISDDRFVGFRGTRADLVEGGIIDLTVEFNPAPATDISLTVSSTNVGIMATEGTDYTVLDVTGSNPTYTLAVPGGATTASFRLMAATDAVVDDGERVALTLTAPVGYRLTDNATFTITLLNVRANTAGFAQAASSGVEGDVASMINVTVNPAPASDLPVTITRGGTASGTDFSPAGLAGSDPNYTLTIPAGQTSASFSVSALYDTEVDERETVTFTVTAPTDHNLGEYSVHTFTITDTPVRTVDFAVDRVTIVEGDDAQTVTINIDQPIPNQSLNLLITVDDFNFGQVGYELSENLRAPTGRGIRHSLELPAGDSSASFVVTISDDDMIQSLRSLSFTLSTLEGEGGSLYTIGSPGVYRLDVTDDDGGDVPLSPISLANDGQSGSMTQGGPIMPTRETSFELTGDGFQVMGGGSAIFSRTGGLYIRAPIAVSVDLVEEDNPSTTPFRNITRVGEYVKILDEMDIPNTDTNIAYLLRVYTPDNRIQGTHGITLRFMD